MKQLKKLFAFLMALGLFIPMLQAAIPLELSAYFQSKMVLQRGREIKVWGKVTPGDKVTVKFAGQTVTSAAADSSGVWVAKLSALSANTSGQTLTVTHGTETQSISNVLVGDVWLCGGQSNMEWHMNSTYDYTTFQTDAKNLPIRYFDVVNAKGSSPEGYKFPSGTTWRTASEAFGDFSAVSFFFARALTKDNSKVPIGIVCTAVGGRILETFLSAEMYADNPTKKSKIAADSIKMGGETIYGFQHWNAMYEPLKRASFTGCLFYQGCSNGDRNTSESDYRDMLTRFIKGLRKIWGDNLPFYNVQLAGSYYVGQSRYVQIREAQLNVYRQVANTGLVPAADLFASDFHPKCKITVGNHLARWARRDIYKESIQAPGPIVQGASYSGNQCTVYFKPDTVGKGLVLGYKKWQDNALPVTCASKGITTNLNCFSVSADGKTWHTASGKITSANSVVVSSAKVSSPKYVRFAYDASPCGWSWGSPNPVLSGPGINLYCETTDGVLLLAAPFGSITCQSGGYTPPVTHQHVWGAWTTNAAPTCVKAGSRSRACTAGCGEKETETLSALGHNWQESSRTSKSITYICTRCKETNVIMLDPSISDLPSGYTALQYVKSTAAGQQYVKTDVKIKKGLRIQADFSAVSVPTGTAVLFGAYKDPTSGTLGNEAYVPAVSTDNKVGVGIGANMRQWAGTATASNHVDILMGDEWGFTYILNGRTTLSRAKNIAAPDLPLYLFGSNRNGTTVDHFIEAKLYSCKVYTNENVLVHYFVPARKNDSSLAGLYDLKTGTFFTSASGTPLEGSDGSVTPPQPPAHNHVWGVWTTNVEATCETVGMRTRTCTASGCLTPPTSETQELPALGHDFELIAATTSQITYQCSRCSKKKYESIEVEPTRTDLPAEYTLLDYLKTDGSQYLDTGIAAQPRFRARFAFKAEGVVSSTDILLGAYESSREAYLPGVANNGNLLAGVGYSQSRIESDVSGLVSNTVEIVLSAKESNKWNFSLGINGEVWGEQPIQNNPTALTLYLFARNIGENKTPDRGLSATFYEAKLYTNDTSLVHFYIPVRKGADAVGLYDLKGKKFYALKGALAGPDAVGGGSDEPPPAPPVTDVTGKYVWNGGSAGEWAKASNWDQVINGSYPHLATDGAEIKLATTIDLNGGAYSIAALTNLASGTVLKNGKLTASGKGIYVGRTMTFEDMTLSGYRMYAYTGETITFVGTCALTDAFYFHTCNTSGLVIREGVTTMQNPFSWYASPILTLSVENARLVASALTAGTVRFNLKLGANNLASTDAMLTFSESFVPNASSTLTIDAANLNAGTYPLIAAKTLTDTAKFAKTAVITNLKEGLEAQVSLANNTLSLVVTGASEPEPPTPIETYTPQPGLHVWTAGNGAWTNVSAWTTKPEGGCWPDHAGALVRIDSSATIDLAGGSFRFAAMTNKGAAVTLKNGTLTQAKGLIQNEAASLTFENMTLVNESATASAYSDHAIRPYVDGAAITFVGDNTVRGYLLRTSNNNNTFAFKDGATSFDQGFNFGTSARTAALKIDNATVSFGGSLPTELYTLNIALSFGAKNSGLAPLLSFGGSFAPYSHSTLTVDAAGLAVGTYTLIAASTFTDNASFATKTVVENVPSGLTAMVALSQNKLTLTLTSGGTSGSEITPFSGNMSVNVEAASSDAARALVKITAPEGVSQSVYEGYFTLKVTKIATGHYTVEAVLDAEKIAYEDTLNSFVSQLGKGKSQIAISAKAGLYYAIQKAETLSALTSASKSAWVKAEAGSVNLNVSLPSGAKSGFYKVIVSPTNK